MHEGEQGRADAGNDTLVRLGYLCADTADGAYPHNTVNSDIVVIDRPGKRGQRSECCFLRGGDSSS